MVTVNVLTEKKACTNPQIVVCVAYYVKFNMSVYFNISMINNNEQGVEVNIQMNNIVDLSTRVFFL